MTRRTHTRTRTHKRKTGIFKKSYRKISSASRKILPAVKSGVEAVGTAATTVGKKTLPVVESGVNTIWTTLKKGTGMLFSTVKKGVGKITGRRHGRKSRSTRRRMH
jgi:hypothetical protein